MTGTGDIDTQTRAELEGLLTEFAYRADHGLAATVHELFTEAGSLRAPGLALRGKSEIAAQFASRAADTRRLSRHFWSNPRYERLAADIIRVTTTAQTLVHRLADGEVPPSAAYTLIVGDSIDVCEAGADGRWRFQSRELVVTFCAQHGAAGA